MTKINLKIYYNNLLHKINMYYSQIPKIYIDGILEIDLNKIKKSIKKVDVINKISELDYYSS